MNLNYQTEGKIQLINETQEFSGGFKKREIVIMTDEAYPQTVKLEFHKELVTKLDDFKVGDFVNIRFSIRGNEYNGNYYNNLIGFAIAQSQNGTPAPVVKTVGDAEFPLIEGDENDDLPF